MIIHPLHYWLLALLTLAGLAPLAQAVAPAAPSNCTAVTYNATATTATIDISWNDNSTTETQWRTLCRYRHNVFYADMLIMRTSFAQ